MNKIIVWALFDSGNGCYNKVASEFKNIEIYSIGLDIENKNNHFINLNLANYNYFGENEIYKILDSLPKPDVIIASPPCESWSVASAMRNGNACWKQENLGGLLDKNNNPLSRFTLRSYIDYENVQFKPIISQYKRLNGELCTINLVEVIKKYNPKVYIIENPLTSRIWDYMKLVLGFSIKYDNPTRYNNYDDYPIQKPTKFMSNIELKLKNAIIKGQSGNLQKQSWSYNERSNIPLSLVKSIFEQVLEHIKMEG